MANTNLFKNLLGAVGILPLSLMLVSAVANEASLSTTSGVDHDQRVQTLQTYRVDGGVLAQANGFFCY